MVEIRRRVHLRVKALHRLLMGCQESSDPAAAAKARAAAMPTVDDYQEALTLEGHTIVAFSPDEKLLATGGGQEEHREGEVKLWDASSGQRTLTLTRLAGRTVLLGILFPSIPFSGMSSSGDWQCADSPEYSPSIHDTEGPPQSWTFCPSRLLFSPILTGVLRASIRQTDACSTLSASSFGPIRRIGLQSSMVPMGSIRSTFCAKTSCSQQECT